MREADVTRCFVDDLKRIPGSLVWKFNDRTTAGIPDMIFCYRGLTTWVEVKVIEEIRPLQHRNMILLYQIMRGRALYLLFSDNLTAFYIPPNFPDGPFLVSWQPGATDAAADYLRLLHAPPD